MTADFELKLVLSGNNVQLKKMLQIVDLYSGNGEKPAYFSFIKVNEKTIDFKNIPDDVVSAETLTVTALGPYGRYFELNDVDLFRELAEAVPQATFNAEISGSQQYSVQNLKCEFKDSLLNIETYFEDNSEASEAWVEDFVKKIPLKKFKKLFMVEGEDFNKDAYMDIVNEIGIDFYDDLSDMEFDDFVEYLERYDAESELDDDEFSEIIETKLAEFGIISQCDFEEDYEGGETHHYVYDPAAKSYISNKKPLLEGIPAGQAFDANDILAKGLEAQGLPNDADALANLSIEEAYAALAASMGLDSEDDDEDDDEDFEDDDE